MNPKVPKALPWQSAFLGHISSLFQSKIELCRIRVSVGAHITFKKPFAGNNSKSIKGSILLVKVANTSWLVKGLSLSPFYFLTSLLTQGPSSVQSHTVATCQISSPFLKPGVISWQECTRG